MGVMVDYAYHTFFTEHVSSIIVWLKKKHVIGCCCDDFWNLAKRQLVLLRWEIQRTCWLMLLTLNGLQTRTKKNDSTRQRQVRIQAVSKDTVGNTTNMHWM